MSVRHVAPVLAALVALGACASTEAPADGDLRGARAAPDGSTIWVIGGTVVPDEVWNEMTTPSIQLSSEAKSARDRGTNDELLQYDPGGRLIQAVDVSALGLSRDALYGNLMGPTAASSTTGTVVTASPSVAIAIHDGEASLLPASDFQLDDATTTELRAVGSVGPEVFIALVDAASGPPGLSGSDVVLRAVDPATRQVRSVELPPEVWSTTGVCVHDGRLLAASGTSIQEGAPRQIDIWQVDGSGADRAQLVSVPAATPFAGLISLVCTARQVWLVEQNEIGGFRSPSNTTVRSIDVARGSASGPWTGPNGFKALPGGASVGDDLVLSHLSPDEVGERYPHRWVDGVVGPPAETSDAYFPTDSYLVSVSGRLLDVSPLLAHPPGGDAPPAAEVSVPPVD